MNEWRVSFVIEKKKIYVERGEKFASCIFQRSGEEEKRRSKVDLNVILNASFPSSEALWTRFSFLPSSVGLLNALFRRVPTEISNSQK